MGLKGIYTGWGPWARVWYGRKGSQSVGIGMGNCRDVYRDFLYPEEIGECEKPRGTTVWSGSWEREKMRTPQKFQKDRGHKEVQGCK